MGADLMADPLLRTVVVADQRRLMAEADTLAAEAAVEGMRHPVAEVAEAIAAEVEATVAVDVTKSKQPFSKKPPERAAFLLATKSILVKAVNSGD
jgi:hypothetical protein